MVLSSFKWFSKKDTPEIPSLSKLKKGKSTNSICEKPSLYEMNV